MSSWTEVHKGASNGSELAAVEGCQSNFAGNRILLQAITGYVPGEKTQVPPVSITIFYEMGHVKLCVNDKHGKRLGFVTLTEGHESLAEAIEAALEGRLEWRKKREGENGPWQGGRK